MITDMEAQSVVKVSTKGQIVIPKGVRDRFGIVPGRKLLVAVDDDEILLRRVEEISLGELSRRLSRHAERKKVDVDALVDDAIRWARK
jgi:AbrB family looped-hinge helix DNA binding protein